MLKVAIVLFLILLCVSNYTAAEIIDPKTTRINYADMGFLVNGPYEKMLEYYGRHPELCYEVVNTAFNDAFPKANLYFFISPRVSGQERVAIIKWKNKIYHVPTDINRLLIDCGIKINKENQVALAKAYIVAANIDKYVDKLEFTKIEEGDFDIKKESIAKKGSVKIDAHAYVSEEHACMARIPPYEMDVSYEFGFRSGQFRVISRRFLNTERLPSYKSLSFPRIY